MSDEHTKSDEAVTKMAEQDAAEKDEGLVDPDLMANAENDASAVATAEAPATGDSSELFNASERAEFDAADVEAGRAIGKMLSLFFLYTVIAMSIVAWWTHNASH